MFKHYIASALRHFARHKITTIINVISLALGIACFAVAYGLSQYYTHGDLYHEKAARTFFLTETASFNDASETFDPIPLVGWSIAPNLKVDYPELELVARATRAEEMSIAAATSKEFAKVVAVDPEFLDIFDLDFLSGDRRAALRTPHSAVISDALAHRIFGSTDVLGKALLLNGRETVHIAGVISEPRQPSHMSFSGVSGELVGMQFTLLISMDTSQALLRASNPAIASSSIRFYTAETFTYLVFAPGSAMTHEHLRADLPQFVDRHIPTDYMRVELDLRPASEIYAAFLDFSFKASKTGIPGHISMTILGSLILLIACLNYANLASAQATTRLKELALRRVVGASHRQIIMQSFCESLLVVTVAAGLSVGMLPGMIRGVSRGFGLDIRPLLLGAPYFWLWLAIAVVAVAMLACAYPAFVAARIGPAHALQSGRAPITKRRTMRLLVMSQFSAASLLFILSSVMSSQTDVVRINAGSTNDSSDGYATDRIVLVENNLKQANVDINPLQSELRKQSTVNSVSAINSAPGGVGFRPAGLVLKSADPSSPRWMITAPVVDHDFFATLGIQLLAGRDFDRAHANDLTTDVTPGNVIIDRALASDFGWNNPADAIGKAIYTYAGAAPPGAPTYARTIIGVVENAPLYPIVMAGSMSTMYSLSPSRASVVLVRVAKGSIAKSASEIDAVWQQLAPSTPLKRQFLNEVYEASYKKANSFPGTIRALAIFALLIGMMGLVGIATHAMVQRRYEIGVRKTLGASATRVLLMLLKDFSKPIIVANLIVWPLAYVIAKAYSSWFAEKVPITIVPFIASLVVGLVIAWLAVLRQATSAARMNPATVLRHE